MKQINTDTNTPTDTDAVIHVFNAVKEEVAFARAMFLPFNSLHEAHSVLLEEMHELFDEVKKKQLMPCPGGEKMVPNVSRTEGARKEAIQVAAMAIRLILDCCEREGPSYGK